MSRLAIIWSIVFVLVCASHAICWCPRHDEEPACQCPKDFKNGPSICWEHETITVPLEDWPVASEGSPDGD